MLDLVAEGLAVAGFVETVGFFGFARILGGRIAGRGSACETRLGSSGPEARAGGSCSLPGLEARVFGFCRPRDGDSRSSSASPAARDSVLEVLCPVCRLDDVLPLTSPPTDPGDAELELSRPLSPSFF